MIKHHIMIADLLVCMKFRNPETKGYFKDFQVSPKQTLNKNLDVIITKSNSRKAKESCPTIYVKDPEAGISAGTPSFTEYAGLLGPAADALLSYKRCIFHGASFAWKNKAYILTAPSGTGKTTQLRNWKRLYKDEIQIIDGDKPALFFQKDGNIQVYPSPWSGKEKWRGKPEISYPLAGIVYLRQENENSIRLLDPEEAVLPLFTQVLYTGRTVNDIKNVASYVEGILNSIPVWELVNNGDICSAEMTRITIERYGKCH